MNIIWKGSPFYTKGRGKYKPEAIVLHIMDGSLIGTDSWFNNKDSGVSAHYGVGKTGEIHQYVHEEDNAYHAGKVEAPSWSLLKPNVNPNLYTIGIEHEGHPADVWTEEMKKSSVALIIATSQRWGIPIDREHIIGHYQISGIRRANCPAVNKSIIDELITRAKGPIPKPNNNKTVKQVNFLVLETFLSRPDVVKPALINAAELVSMKTNGDLELSFEFLKDDTVYSTETEKGYPVVAPASVMNRAKTLRPDQGYKIVTLLFNTDHVTGTKPTNPYANEYMDNNRVMHQISEQWYNGYSEVLTEFFLHEFCHNMYFLVNQTGAGLRDTTHDWNGTQAANTTAYYLDLINSLKPYWDAMGFANISASSDPQKETIMKVNTLHMVTEGQAGAALGLMYENNVNVVTVVLYNDLNGGVNAYRSECARWGKNPDIIDVVISRKPGV